MAARPDPTSPLRRPAAGPVPAPGPGGPSWPGPPRPFRRGGASVPASGGAGDAARAAGTGGAPHDVPHDGSDPYPASHTGFLTGRRGPRTTALLLTTGAIGSALAALLVASGVLTPTAPRDPSGLPAPPAPPAPRTSPPTAPPAAAPSAPTPSPFASSPSASPTPTAPTSAPPAAAPPASTPSPGPSGSGDGGVLRLGDSGPAVSELQRRLSRVPEVYPEGTVDGRYDAALARAVARFQRWYGIRGDEEGVYGDDTRRDLESRT